MEGTMMRMTNEEAEVIRTASEVASTARKVKSAEQRNAPADYKKEKQTEHIRSIGKLIKAVDAMEGRGEE